MNAIPSPDLARREDFAPWLVARGLDGLAIEVGVHRAAFAAAFLAGGWAGIYIGVDPWRVLPDYQDRLDLSDSKSQAAREADYAAARAALHQWMDRAFFFRSTSAGAAALMADEIADFVYLDGCHEYKSIKADLRLWLPKLRPGGILAGHDYGGCWAGTVGRAVDEFAAELGLRVFEVAANDSGNSSWYLLGDG